MKENQGNLHGVPMHRTSPQELRELVSIAPWICHLCQSEFGLYGGGICFDCRKPACRLHLKISIGSPSKPQEGEVWLCTRCSDTGGEVCG
jgi:hypothetical protein